jgi:hypothetical protein
MKIIKKVLWGYIQTKKIYSNIKYFLCGKFFESFFPLLWKFIAYNIKNFLIFSKWKNLHNLLLHFWGKLSYFLLFFYSAFNWVRNWQGFPYIISSVKIQYWEGRMRKGRKNLLLASAEAVVLIDTIFLNYR